MIDFLKSLLSERDPPRPAPDVQASVAALLVETARADGVYAPEERTAIDRFLAQLFGVKADVAARLRMAGEAAQAEAADTVRFTRVVKTQLAAPDRARLLEALWRVVLADGDRDPHEDALLRKLPPLLGLTDHDSAAARRRAAEG